MNIQVQANDLIEAITAQRNKAQEDSAINLAVANQLQRRVVELEAELKRRDAEKPASDNIVDISGEK